MNPPVEEEKQEEQSQEKEFEFVEHELDFEDLKKVDTKVSHFKFHLTFYRRK